MQMAFKKGLGRFAVFLVVLSTCWFLREYIVFWPVLLIILVGGGAYCVLDGFFNQ